MTWADLAARRSDWGTAATRWREVIDRFPETHEAYMNGGQAFQNAGNAAEADAILLRGVTALPDDVRIAIAYAEGPVRQNLLDRSIERYRDVLGRFPAVPEVYIRTAITYQRAGQHHEAETCLAEGVGTCPAAADVA